MEDSKKDVKKMAQSDERITLSINGADGNKFKFTVKKHAKLRELLVNYSKRARMDITSLRFRFGGEGVHEHATPADMKMEEGDEIEIFQWTDGGAPY